MKGTLSFFDLDLKILVMILLSYPMSTSGQTLFDIHLSDTGSSPSIKIDHLGNVHAAWANWNGHATVYEIFDSALNVVKNPSFISQQPYVIAPRLAVSESVRVVVWENYPPFFFGDTYIFGEVLTTTGDTLGTNLLFSGNQGLQSLPDVTYVNDSTFFVCWSGQGPGTSGSGVYGQEATNSRAFIGANILLSDDTVANPTNTLSRIASNTKANTMAVVWLNGTSPGSIPIARVFLKDGTPLAPSFAVSEIQNFQNTWGTSIRMDTSGNFTIAWSGQRDTIWGIYARRFDKNATPLDTSVRVSDSAAIDFADVEISGESSGKYIVAWEGKSGAYSRIFCQRFLSDGSELGKNFKISSLPDTLSHYWPTIILENDKIYFAWKASGIWASIIDWNSPPTAVDETGNKALPTSFYLYQNFPNPFNPTTTIRYNVPVDARVSLVVYDVLGRIVKRFVEMVQSPGFHSVKWDAGNYTSGVYFVRLEAVDLNKNRNVFTAVRKMLVMR